MGWLARRRQQKANDEVAVALFTVMAEHLEAGGSFEDFLTPTVEEAVEWNQKEQTWYVDCVLPLPGVAVESLVSLVSGRGGMIENAVVTGVESGSNVDVDPCRYYLSFDSPALEGRKVPWFKQFMDL